MTLSLLIDPKGTQTFVHQVLCAIDLESDDPIMGSEQATDLLPGYRDDMAIVGPYYICSTGGTHILMELATLGYIMRVLKPNTVFEIGTHVGRTTRLMLLNAPSDCNIFTLDLPQEQVTHLIGSAFRETPEATRIHQIHSDSRIFDYSPWRNACDFVWVDACHDYDYVISDSAHAFDICRSGGWIGWHDYRHSAWWSGVTRGVRELHSQYPQIRHIRGTTIALCQKS